MSDCTTEVEYAGRFTQIDSTFADQIANRYNSPVYIMDEIGILQRLAEFQQATRSLYPNSVTAFSYKTNPLRGLLIEIHRLGTYAEVVSRSEYGLARSVNVSPNRMVFNGPAKPDDVLIEAISANSIVNCDHADEIDRIESLASRARITAKIGIRLCFTGEGNWNRFGFIATGDTSTNEALQIAERVMRSPHLVLAGIHAQTGTDIRDLATFAVLGTQLAKFAELLRQRFEIELSWIDVGGGLAGITPKSGEIGLASHPLPSLAEYAEAIVRPLLSYLRSTARPATLLFEPGRTLLDPFGGLLVTVLGRRTPAADGIPGIILDAGITSIATVGEYNHPVHACKNDSCRSRYHLFGPTCMQCDRVRASIELPRLELGDRLIILGVGAYSMSQANFFSHHRPGVLSWKAGSEMRWLRQTETPDHAIRIEPDV